MTRCRVEIVGSWEKGTPTLSRETAGGHETPARSLTFRLTAGLTAGRQALTHQRSLLPPPARYPYPLSAGPARANRPHFTLFYPPTTCWRSVGLHPPVPRRTHRFYTSRQPLPSKTPLSQPPFANPSSCTLRCALAILLFSNSPKRFKEDMYTDMRMCVYV